jgi:predicted transglutaminase-like cysteine proteinase
MRLILVPATRSGHGVFGGTVIGSCFSAIGTFAWLLAMVILAAGHAADVQAAEQGGKPALALVGAKEVKREGVLQRRVKDDQADRDCNPGIANCPLRPWKKFLASLVGKPAQEQLSAVNAYGNRMKYIQDIDNYGVDDYWATPKEFIFNSGDCEDYVIFKYFSLRDLGFGVDSMRIVTVQDTNLRIAHAVLAVYINNDILILDNQTESVISHHKILHYAPIYSVNESHWWMHMN